MEQMITISQINDFLYSPKSLYLHSIYQNFDKKTYDSQAQIKGKNNHQSIDQKNYSTAKQYIQNLAVFCSKYNFIGKIDLYDSKNKILIERKTKIKKVHKGHKYQLYAQMFCMEEMGYKVDKLKIHSLEDNKIYWIKKPNQAEIQEFENIINQIKNYNPLKAKIDKESDKRCEQSIYKDLMY